MPTLPWTIPNQAPPGAEVYVMASRFEVRSFKDVPRFFWNSLSVWGQVRRAPGAYGASLIARPFQRVFYTLSAWQDRDAVYAFARTEPHRSAMKGLGPTMRGSTFTFWQATADRLPITWADAMERLAEQERADALEAGGAGV
ncbi:DUF3291 domain-containing protein [Streptomyces sp. NPDC026206]|uniref:DUF3291 domain-containing protein n=1 Tax=Streptomyces sp. NPDC026206 TaxID=3157089 RepID=UPI0033FE8FEC